MRRLAPALLGLLPAMASAAPWRFERPIEVAPGAGPGVFHHLESAGRRNLAVSGGWVAVAWEDNRTSAPQAYVALKPAEAGRFREAQRLSTGKQAFEPAIAPLGHGRFIAVWEQDDAVWMRALDARSAGAAEPLAGPGANQASVTARDGIAYVVWSERAASGHASIRIARVESDAPGKPLRVTRREVVDRDLPKADQGYPSVALAGSSVAVAWEDRRRGHTVLLYSHASLPALRFATPQRLNEQPPPRSAIYGRGTGVARVGLVEWGRQGVAATWLDKRDFTSGYDVYAAFCADGKRFGPNEKVQDEFGNAISQWHAAIAANANGQVAVLWNDDRDETPDIWLSWRKDGEWSADEAVPGASGPGDQSSPAIALDETGNLHLAWIERTGPESPTRIRYMRGVFSESTP